MAFANKQALIQFQKPPSSRFHCTKMENVPKHISKIALPISPSKTSRPFIQEQEHAVVFSLGKNDDTSDAASKFMTPKGIGDESDFANLGRIVFKESQANLKCLMQVPDSDLLTGGGDTETYKVKSMPLQEDACEKEKPQETSDTSNKSSVISHNRLKKPKHSSHHPTSQDTMVKNHKALPVPREGNILQVFKQDSKIKNLMVESNSFLQEFEDFKKWRESLADSNSSETEVTSSLKIAAIGVVLCIVIIVFLSPLFTSLQNMNVVTMLYAKHVPEQIEDTTGDLLSRIFHAVWNNLSYYFIYLFTN